MPRSGGRPDTDLVAHRIDRGRASLRGLAIGDALGRPAENLSAEQIQDRYGRITDFVDEVVGTDDTEFAIFSGTLLAKHGSALTMSDASNAWRSEIVGRGGLAGAGFSTMGAVVNMQRGLDAPQTAQHSHAWSDELAMRAAVFGVFAPGKPAEAARLAVIEGSVTMAGEGLHSGAAVAAAVSAAMDFTDWPGAVEAVHAAALSVVPSDSWTARNISRAKTATADGGPNVETRLLSSVVPHYYPWTDLGPEAVGLAFGALRIGKGQFVESVLTAVNMGRDADTTAAIVGSICGALHGEAGLPSRWLSRLAPATGSCLPTVAGVDIGDVAEELVQASVAASENSDD